MKYNEPHIDFSLDHSKNQDIPVCFAFSLPRLSTKCEQWLIDNSRPSTGSRKLMQIMMMYDTYAQCR